MSPPFDISLVRNAAGHQPLKLLELLQLCRESLQGDLASLTSLLEQASASLADKRKMAHRVYGAAKMIGAHGLANACQLVKQADEGTIDALLIRVIEEAMAVEECVAKYISLNCENSVIS